MLERTRRALLVAAVASLAAACGPRVPYHAPAPSGPSALEPEEAARVLVLVVAEADPRISPVWLEHVERAGRAVDAALAAARFRTTREPRARWAVRVAVSCPLRGADFAVRVEARGAVVDRLEVNGKDWGPDELAELGQVVRQRVERLEVVAELAGRPPRPPASAPPAAPALPGSAATAPGPEVPAAPPGPAWRRAVAAPAAKGRLAVLEFRGAAPPQLLALLADQARAAAVDAVRSSGASVMTRESAARRPEEKGGPPATCADGGCELDTARLLGADLVVTGEVSSVGGAQLLVLKLVDVAAGALLASRTARGADELALVEATRAAAAALFE